MPKLKNQIQKEKTLKPLVKDFVDPEKDLLDFINSKLPALQNTTISMKQVRNNKSKTVFCYRVNYWQTSKDTIIPKNNIVKSLYCRIEQTKDGYLFEEI